MDSSIVVALITSIFGIIGIIITNMSSNKKVESTIKTNQAVTDTKIGIAYKTFEILNLLLKSVYDDKAKMIQKN